jgi:hypothetical protein
MLANIADAEVIEADTIIGALGQGTNTQFLYNDLRNV